MGIKRLPQHACNRRLARYVYFQCLDTDVMQIAIDKRRLNR